MNARNIQINAKKISELEDLSIMEKIINSYIVVSYTENGAKENYKIKLQYLIDQFVNLKEYALNIITNGAKLTNQINGSYRKDDIISLTFIPLSSDYQLTDDSYFTTNCVVENASMLDGKLNLNIKVTGVGNPIICISAESLITYMLNYSGLTNMQVELPKSSFKKNEIFELTLTADKGYKLPESINDFILTGGQLMDYNKLTGKLKIKVNENMVLSGNAIELPKFNVNVNIENASYIINSSSSIFYKDDIFTITINPIKGYYVPQQLNVTNGTIISYDNNIVTIKINGTGDVNVNGAANYKEIPLSIECSNLTYELIQDQLTYHINDVIKIIMTPDDGYVSPNIDNIISRGCEIISYENNELFIKIIDDNNVYIKLNAEIPYKENLYYFGMTYSGEGYFKEKIITASTGETLHIFDNEDTLININSPYISSSINSSPIPYNDFNITNNYTNVAHIEKYTFIALVIPKKYVLKNGNGYLFLDDDNNKYKIQQFGRDISNFEQLKWIYEDDIIDWEVEFYIDNIPHYLLYFKDEDTAGEYKFIKIS